MNKKVESLVIKNRFSYDSLNDLLNNNDNLPFDNIGLLVLDFSNTEYVNSHSIGLLLELSKSLSERHVALAIANPSDVQCKVFKITGLHLYVRIYKDVKAATDDPEAYNVNYDYMKITRGKHKSSDLPDLFPL